MQPVDLTQFPNTSGWHIAHNANLMTYELKSSNGVTKPGSYTHRKFAERALHDYLIEMKNTAPKNAIKKKTKKPVNNTPVLMETIENVNS
jgi:hypothetical protein|tara:strand:- start:42 stop:311 length:270 start_codon:yes stop_codon:yes gene_type:complete